MRRLVLAAAALTLAAACGGTTSIEACWEDAVNRPSSEGGCQGLTHPDIVNACLAFHDQECQKQAG